MIIIKPKNYPKRSKAAIAATTITFNFFVFCFIYAKSSPKWPKYHRKIVQKSSKNRLKIVSKSDLGASWSSLGASWGVLGAWTPSLGCLGAVLEPSWGRPGAALGRLGGLLGRPWGLLGRLGHVLGRLERILWPIFMPKSGFLKAYHLAYHFSFVSYWIFL